MRFIIILHSIGSISLWISLMKAYQTINIWKRMEIISATYFSFHKSGCKCVILSDNSKVIISISSCCDILNSDGYTEAYGGHRDTQDLQNHQQVIYTTRCNISSIAIAYHARYYSCFSRYSRKFLWHVTGWPLSDMHVCFTISTRNGGLRKTFIYSHVQFFLNVSECWNECVILWMFLCLVCSTITMSVLPNVTCNAHSY